MGDIDDNNNQDQVKHNPFWLDGHTFVYDPISKVYKAESERQNEQGREEGYRVSPVVPIGVVVKRDWLAFITSLLIGLGTFIVVARYTYYAGGQWDEMRKATVASTKASETAASALDENKRQFQETIAE